MQPIRLPVRHYVKKYITAKYKCFAHLTEADIKMLTRADSLSVNAIWNFTRNDRLGKYFYALLHKEPKVPVRYKLNEDWLTVGIPNMYAKNRGTFLDQDAVDDFNEFVYEEIIEGIVTYIVGLQSRDGMKKYERLYFKSLVKDSQHKRYLKSPDLMQFYEIKEVIYDHLKRFNITENDIPIETIRKNVYRKLKVNLTISKSA